MSSQPQGCPERTGKKKKGGRGTQKRAVKVRMADGACWKGEVDQNRLPHGAGVMTYPGGDRLEGTFVAGAAEGQGYTYVFADGRRYEGGIDAQSRPSGHGAMTSSDGNRHEGTFVGGVLEGHGVSTQRDGDRFEGAFVSGRLQGHGVMESRDGDRYDGRYVNGRMEGRGVYVYASGARYDGQWADGWQEGQGVYVYSSDGGRHAGLFAEDVPVGTPVGTPVGFTLADDDSAAASWEGTWSGGEPVGAGTWHWCWRGTTVHFSGDGPTRAEMDATANPAKWAQVAAVKAAAVAARE